MAWKEMLAACLSKFWGRTIGRRSGLKGETCRRLRSCMNVQSPQGPFHPLRLTTKLQNGSRP